MNIMQGDQYSLNFHLTIDNQEIDMTTIDKIQFKVGDLLKTFINGSQESEIIYDENEHLFFFPLTEDQTFNFSNKNVVCEVRIMFVGGVIKGARISAVQVDGMSIRQKLGGS